MKKKNKFISLFVLIFSLVVVLSGSYALLLEKSSTSKPPNVLYDNSFGWKFPITKFPLTGSNPSLLAYSDIRDPGGIPRGLPVRLNIPVIGVDSSIEDAHITTDGRMDVPEGSVNVAWFALGPKPGSVGSAVIGGHFGISNGIPFVFYDLDKLNIGDHIYIVDDKNKTITFVVRAIKLFDRNADATSVFTSNDGIAHLNLITCEGVWNKVNDTYPERRVVFTDVVGVDGTRAPATTVFRRSLSVGSSGADVVMLQNILEQKKFLVMPIGVTKGYFGKMTAAALAKYQTSVGLQSVGVFGPQTRARLIAEFTPHPGLPSVGEGFASITGIGGEKKSTTSSQKNLSPVLQTFIPSLNILYATPVDGVITFLLLCAIVFMIVKIFKQLHPLT